MTLTNEAISAAQGLASLGWLVFPVNPDTGASAPPGLPKSQPLIQQAFRG